jgi:CHAT domain-containing protein
MQFALADAAATDPDLARHVLTCASCSARIANLRQIVRGIEAAAFEPVLRGAACVDDTTLARFVDGALGKAEHAAALRHLADCGYCRVQVRSLVALLADPAVAGEITQLERNGRAVASRRRVFAVAGLLAAAATVLVVAWPRSPNGTMGEHRGPTLTAAPAPVPIAPIGDVGAVTALRWSAVAGGDRYRIRLFDATAHVLFEAQLTDTSIALPDSVVLRPGRSYLWEVEVRGAWDRWASSELVEFRIGGAVNPDGPVVQTHPADSLRLRMRQLSDSELVGAVRVRPVEVREALSGTLALAVHGDSLARSDELAAARRLAAAYATAWHDAFLTREVARFAAWPPARRADKVWADSVRRAGVIAYSRDGSAAALALWRRAVARATAIPDTAGVLSTLYNIGAVYSGEGALDSATQCLERSRALAAAIGDIRGEANALSELAGVREQRDDVSGARALYARALPMRERVGDWRGLAADYNNIAGLARAAGDFGEAEKQLETALALNRREGQPEAAATNLVNMAALASMRGDFAVAGTHYRSALATWRARERWMDVADGLRGLGDLEIRRGDYPAARAALREALTLYTHSGPLATALAVREALAGVRAAQGDLQGALDDLRSAQRAADSAHATPDVRAGVSLARADLAMQLNLLPEADRLYASAVALYRGSGNRAGEADALQGRGTLFLRQDNAGRAGQMFASALRTQLATGNQRAAALTLALIGDASLLRGDTAAARSQFADAAVQLVRLGDSVASAAAQGERAALEAAMRLPAAAESLFRDALRRAGDRIAPEVTWRLHAGLAAVRRDQRAPDDAAREMRAAIADIERASGSLSLAERRSAFLSDKWAVYVDLALLETARGNISAAFDVSERVRAREMLELLAQGRVAVPRDTAAPIVAREQDLRRRIGELTRGIEGAAAGTSLIRGPDVGGTGAVSREALVRAQADYTELLLELRERAPQHASLVARATATSRDVARRLGPDEAIIEYLLGDKQSVAFVMTRDTLAAIELAVSRATLARTIDFARGTLQPRGVSRLDSLWRAPLRQLHHDLIAPLEASGLLAHKTRLTVVPHAELHYVPFAALLTEGPHGRYLIERYQIAVTPSVSVWLALGTRPASAAGAGILALAPRPDALPASRQEVTAIARLAGTDARVLTGNAATEAAFMREAPGRRVIHLATYGVLNKQNPLFSFVELAPGGSEDGRLEAHEVFGLRLSADLVVLSACQTALASGAMTDVPAGDDWIGLARAFLSAGAARVMASLWPVQDRATATLMERFYQSYTQGVDAGSALASAQRALLAMPATASPYYWAGFELVGGR